MDRTEDFLAHF